jgi:hypothetical protein
MTREEARSAAEEAGEDSIAQFEADTGQEIRSFNSA